jgi:hypothetical protein
LLVLQGGATGIPDMRTCDPGELSAYLFFITSEEKDTPARESTAACVHEVIEEKT